MILLCNLLNGMRVTTKWCYTEYADRLTCPIHYLSKSFLFSGCLRAPTFSPWVLLVPCISKVLPGLVWVAEAPVVSAHIKPLLDWVQINAASLIQQPPGEYLSVSFYSLSFSALSLYSLHFPLIPSSSMWTMIWVTTDPHRSPGNILKSYVLREKVSKRSHVYAVPDSWALKEHTGRRSPPPKKPILVPHYIVRGMGGDISWIPLPVALHISTCPCTQPCVSSVAEDPPASVMLWNYIC